jgi:hypothetical protein
MSAQLAIKRDGLQPKELKVSVSNHTLENTVKMQVVMILPESPAFPFVDFVQTVDHA